MIRIRKGIVNKITVSKDDYQEAIVTVDGLDAKAINYPSLSGQLEIGDAVVLNTTAVELNLGTGGYHFVICNLNRLEKDAPGEGHIMKMRYTPYQVKCHTEEEKALTYDDNSLHGLPVVVVGLHSLIPAVIAGIKVKDSEARIVYIMTDGAALPIALSNLVRELKKNRFIEATITCGHAFGGDCEAVNIYSALTIAKNVLKADYIIVGMGPGIVGTGSQFGFTGTEQASIFHAVKSLDGMPIACLRMSFADKRDRHYAVSHHSLTVLEKLTHIPVNVVVPFLDEQDKNGEVFKKLADASIIKKHYVHVVNGNEGIEFAKEHSFVLKTMGRGLDAEIEFFKAGCASGVFAAECKRRDNERTDD